MPSLVLVIIFAFALTCLWGMWCHGLGTHVKIDFRNLGFTVRSQFHHKCHTNRTNRRARSGHMRRHSHNAAILAGNEETKHAGYEDGKRGVTGHENDADSNKEGDKNEERENRETQATHTTHAQTIEILKSLIAKSQIVSEQKVIEQQALSYSLFIQVLWYQAFVQSLARSSTAPTHSCLFCTDRIRNTTPTYMNISHSRVSSDSENGRKSTSEEQLALRTPSTHSRTSSADVSVQTESSTMAAQQTIRYLIPFPAPGVPGAPYFNGSDATRFLDRFKLLGENHGVEDAALVKKLPEYCEPGIQEEVKAQEGYIAADWEQLRRQLRKRYYRYDTYQQMYSKSFLEAYKDQERTMDDDIESYCSTFKSISANLETQQMLDNHTRCCWFLAGLPKKMRSKLMEKHDVDPQDPTTMVFSRLYEDGLKKARKMERERGLGKKMGEDTLKVLNRQKEKPLKNDPINVRADGTLPSVVKQVVKEKDKEKPKENGKDKSNAKEVGQSQIDELTSKFESLALNLNALSEQLKQRDRPCEVPRQANAAGPGYAPNPRPTCYGCGKTGHNMRNCADIDALINQGIVHRDDSGRLAWGREGTHGISVRLMHGLLWKDDIVKQAKDRETMAAARANVALVHAADAAIEARETVRSQNIELCDDDNDPDDTDEEYVDPDSCNPLDVLAALMETRGKLQSNAKDKNKKVTQGRIEKEKRYPVPRILRRGEYLDAPQQKGSAQRDSARDQTIENSPTPTQTEAGDDAGPSNDITMTDKPARRAPVPRGKKLAKELKDRAKESSEKLLMLLMGQEVRGITVQDILGSSLSVHKMMFQNLPPELRENIDGDEVVQISSTAIDNGEEGSGLSTLWAVGTLKYRVNIGKGTVQSLLDSGAEINVMLYHVALKLGLAVQSNVAVAMKGAGDLKSPFIGYIPDVTVRIGDVVVKQPFFILEKGSNACILGRPFETITRMARQTLNDGSVRVTVFDPENDSIQATFQAYAPGDVGDRYGYQVVEANTIQPTGKHL